MSATGQGQSKCSYCWTAQRPKLRLVLQEEGGGVRTELDVNLSLLSRHGPPAVVLVVPDLQAFPLPVLKLPLGYLIAGQRLKSPQRIAAIQPVVVAHKLREGLLEQRHPQLLAVGPREDRGGRAAVDGNHVVDDHRLEALGLAAVELQHVPAARVVLIGEEHALDRARVLSQAGQRGHKPAVAELALPNVRGLDLAGEEPRVLALRQLADLVAAAPLDLRVDALLIQALPLADGLGVRFEGAVLVAEADAAAAAAEAAAVEAAAQGAADAEPQLAARADGVGGQAREEVDADAMPDQDERERQVPQHAAELAELAPPVAHARRAAGAAHRSNRALFQPFRGAVPWRSAMVGGRTMAMDLLFGG